MGTKVDEQDPACVPNAKYTLGEFSVSGISLVFAHYYRQLKRMDAIWIPIQPT